jgi:hypothetical protein
MRAKESIASIDAAKLTSLAPAAVENSAEMKAAFRSDFFSTGNLCLIPAFFQCKSVFIKVS